MLAPDISEIKARRARLGIFQAMPIVRAPIPPKVFQKRPKDYIRIETAPPEPSERVPQPRDAHEREEEAAVVPLHRVAAERWKDVLREVAEKHGITRTALISRRREKRIVHARQEACYRLVVELGMSYPATARRVNYFDHTTAIHSVKQHAKRFGLEITRDYGGEQSPQDRAAAVVRGFVTGKTVKELAEQYDLSENRTRAILLEYRQALEEVDAQ